MGDDRLDPERRAGDRQLSQIQPGGVVDLVGALLHWILLIDGGMSLIREKGPP
jgi:hypothetical protein